TGPRFCRSFGPIFRNGCKIPRDWNPRMARPKRTLLTPALTLSELRRELESASDAKRAKNLAWFFKTGKGEYGEGDQFCGITVPALRKIASRCPHLKLSA